MAKLFPKLVCFLAVLLLCQFGYVACQSTNSSDRNATLPADEEKALEDLLIKLEWGFHPNISRSACSSNFEYIKCDCTDENSTVCHVTGLTLPDQDLTGEINAEALARLVHLNAIDLSKNQLHGSIPPILGNLSSLNRLDLSTNFLSGSIPPSLGNLTSSLQYLRLSRNFLSGSIPLSMGNLTKLKHMSLSSNKLSDQIPEELGNLSSLRYMDLGFNELTGQLPPQLGELKYLNHLDVGSNNLSGELPGNYANFSTWDQLRWFSVAGNRLTGQVPKFIANWNGLSYLDLSFNNLTGGIPDSMEKLNLSFSQENMLNGTVPSWVTDNIEDKADLSYNNFEIPRDGPKKGEGKLNIEPNRNSIRDLTDKCRGKPKYKTIKVPGGQGSRRWRDFTPNKIIDGTRKFSPKMKIGGGRFGIVYEAELPNKEKKLAVDEDFSS
ncbi:hypothetical protein D5086_028694 [Populus alba]|uniref:Uncharacterized protein n=1 Tax=Populus alba TaxID=43335 RepID=A0ACC4AS20_POPAL